MRNFIPRGDLALPDFCGLFKNSKFKMADCQEKHESKHVPYEEIFADINSENLPKLSKEKLKSFCNFLKLKVSGEKKELVQRLEPLGKCKQLFDKKVARIQEDYKFSTALDPSSIPPPSARWKVIGKNTDVAAPIVTESTIKEYQKAKYAGGKGQYRKAYRLFSSRRIMSVKATEASEHSGVIYVKASILKSYTGSVSRPATILFANNTPVKAYCGCAVGKSGLCCHVIALLIELNYYRDNKKLYLNMSCTEKLQKWHKKGTSVTKRTATQIKLKYLRNLRGARRDIKKVRATKKVLKPSDGTSDFSDWYERDVLEMEGKVKAKLDTIKPSVESHFFSVLSQHKNKSGLFLHLRYKAEFEKKQAGNEYNKDVLKPRFGESTEAVWRSKCDAPESNKVSTKVDQSVTKQQPSLLLRSNYVPVHQCTNDWRALRVGIITASKVPALLGFCEIKEFDSAWFALRNNIDESILNPRRSKLPNFIRGKQEESNALAKFSEDSGFNISECGYFKHPRDKRFGASPDGVSSGELEFLVEIKTRSLPNKSQLAKLNQEETEAKLKAAQTPLTQVSIHYFPLLSL